MILHTSCVPVRLKLFNFKEFALKSIFTCYFSNWLVSFSTYTFYRWDLFNFVVPFISGKLSFLLSFVGVLRRLSFPYGFNRTKKKGIAERHSLVLGKPYDLGTTRELNKKVKNDISGGHDKVIGTWEQSELELILRSFRYYTEAHSSLSLCNELRFISRSFTSPLFPRCCLLRKRNEIHV